MCPIFVIYFVRFEGSVGLRLSRIAATLKATANKKVNAKSVLHMATSPRWRRRSLFLFCDFFWIGHHHRRWRNANLRVILTIFVIVAAPCAQTQTPAPPKVTKADAQKVLKIISSDKAKTRIYCQMAKLSDQMEQANEKGDSKKFDELFQNMYELGKKPGPEYIASNSISNRANRRSTRVTVLCAPSWPRSAHVVPFGPIPSVPRFRPTGEDCCPQRPNQTPPRGPVRQIRHSVL